MDENNKEIRILLVLPFFYPHRGGSQKYAEELYAIVMERHPNIKVDVLCYNTDRVSKYEEYRGYRIYRIGCWNILPTRFALPYFWEIIPMLFKLSKNKYDFVNTHIRFFDPTWWLWIYAKLIGAKSIFTGHVATHPVHQSKIVEKIAKFADLTFAKFSLKFYDYITFTNKTAQKFFSEKLGVKKDSYLIYGGINTDFFHPGEKTDRILPKLDLAISDEKVVITYVGRFIWTKGIMYILEAAKSILGKENYREKIKFVLAGPGELEQEIRKEIDENHLGDNITLTGDLNYSQVRNLLSITDIFVNPSHHNEGFPNTVLEAGSSGCYVIATDNAGTWEVVRNGETGQLVPQRNAEELEKAIIWAIENKTETEKIAINFRNFLVKEFDWRIISEKLYVILIK